MSMLATVSVLCVLMNTGLSGAEVKEVTFTVHYVTIRRNLTCDSGEWIHITDYKHDNLTLFDIKKEKYIQQARCVGHRTCITYSRNPGNVTITYECVQTQRFGLCDTSVQGAVYYGQIHLHSHSYPVSRNIDRRCSCTITGSNMNATAYDLNIISPPASFGYKVDSNYKNFTYPIPLNDVFLGEDASEVTLTFYDGGLDDQQVWIQVQAPGQMKVSCVRSPPYGEGSSSTPPTSSFIPRVVTESKTTIRASSSSPTSTTTTSTTTERISAPSMTIKKNITTMTATTSIVLPGQAKTTSTTSLLSTKTGSQSSLSSVSSTPLTPQNATINIPEILIISGTVLVVLAVIAVVIGLCLKYKRNNTKLRMPDPPVNFQAATPPTRGVYSIPEYLHLVNTNNEYSQLCNDSRIQATQHEYSEFHPYETFQPE